MVHMPSDFIAACLPDKLGGLIGDKAVSVVFDNTKIKRFVPGYLRDTPFARGHPPHHRMVRRRSLAPQVDDAKPTPRGTS